MIKLIERIFSYLTEFKNDKIFEEIKFQLLDIIKRNLGEGEIKIFLGPKFKQDEELSQSDDVTIVTVPESATKDYDVCIYIEGESFNYNFEISSGSISLNGYFYDANYVMHNEEYTYALENHLFTKIRDVMDINDYYYDYDIDIVGLDTKEIDTEKLKDKKFSEAFSVPIMQARFYRTHFREFRVLINNIKNRAEMAYEDENSKNNFLFSSPFNLNHFVDIFDLDGAENAYEIILGITDDEAWIKEIEEARVRLASLQDMFASYIGYDGEIVMSNNLYLNFILYAHNFASNFLETRGMIIKKVDERYIVYFVLITSTNMAVTTKEIDKNTLLDIYYSNEANSNVEGLAEFFGVSRGR